MKTFAFINTKDRDYIKSIGVLLFGDLFGEK